MDKLNKLLLLIGATLALVALAFWYGAIWTPEVFSELERQLTSSGMLAFFCSAVLIMIAVSRNSDT